MVNWIELDGVVNMRDVGGIPTRQGLRVQTGRLYRSDNLQDLPPASVRRIIDELGISDIIDLRTHVEVAQEGDGPLRAVEDMVFHHHSLYQEDVDEHGIPAMGADLPWIDEDKDFEGELDGTDTERFWSNYYLQYFERRPDSILAALRAVANARGAALVHCAAGKDRTGTIIALTLQLVGASDEDVIADYAASNERVPLILERFRRSTTYAEDIEDQDDSSQATLPEAMRLLLAAFRHRYGSIPEWFASQGWTAEDDARLRAKLLAEPPAADAPESAPAAGAPEPGDSHSTSPGV